jgi:hypothetical protein
MYTKPATKTWYREIEFDSYHEARWAAMFDLLHWSWDYLKFCLDGRAKGLRPYGTPWGSVVWVPDFSLTNIPSCRRETVVALVEVKPWLLWEEFSEALDKTQRALVACNPTNPNARNILFLGKNSRICFGNGEATGDQDWMDEVDYVAHHLRCQDSGWEETRRILGEGLIDHLA